MLAQSVVFVFPSYFTLDHVCERAVGEASTTARRLNRWVRVKCLNYLNISSFSNKKHLRGALKEVECHNLDIVRSFTSFTFNKIVSDAI